eukprot:gi/632982334/ref/XP_007908080.1/ PREDICTED: uncharacterized protein LOC103189472 [Callorhinchus milii]
MQTRERSSLKFMLTHVQTDNTTNGEPKNWKKSWSELYSASPFGIARLQQFDSSNAIDKQNTKKVERRIIRLSDCISISQVLSETPPKEMSAFCISTIDKTYVMAVQKCEMSGWIERICELAFQNTNMKWPKEHSPHLKMEENEIYSSMAEAPPVNNFTVKIQKTEAATRCKLQGKFVLVADKNSVTLSYPKTNEVVYTWPYKFLRRYGKDQSKFSFEAGRRCASGEGLFVFSMKEVGEIFSIIDKAVQEVKSNSQENRLSSTSIESTGSTTFNTQLSKTSAHDLPDETSQVLEAAASKEAESFEATSKRTNVKANQEQKIDSEALSKFQNSTHKVHTPTKCVDLGEKRSITATDKRESANCPGEIIYAEVSAFHLLPKKDSFEALEEDIENDTDDCKMSPIYMNISNIKRSLLCEEQLTLLKGAHSQEKLLYKNQEKGWIDQEAAYSLIPSPVSQTDGKWSRLSQECSESDTEQSQEIEEVEEDPTFFRQNRKESSSSESPRSSIVTKTTLPPGFREKLTGLYSKEIGKNKTPQESSMDRCGKPPV